ncbi:protein FAR1-RELATED SEQUENCE 5-like [Prunus dulcis]|uniref:protein FAR1-RELATED SEQUENCE 5-like n=1 Tax=Prunus dulcis TaxID=3755 RepID=UPI0014820F6E|nr:protein FAR1-RELATED SEQUENCE 5-like [Prunus dulcis]
MVFDTMEEARNYYEEYGRQEGFWIRTRSSSKTRRRLDEVTSRQFVCAHEGKYVPKNTSQKASEENDERDISEIENMKRTGKNCSTVKCGCTASMRIKLDRWSNKWKVSSFQDSHNHKPVTPERRMKMKSNRVMPKAAKILTETFHEENLPIAKVPSILGGPHIGFNNRDCYNHLRNVRYRQLDGGDAQGDILWLFETWLEAMGGRHLVSIITVQDLAMKGAIAKIFPNTRHRLWLWHIKKKFVEKLSHVYFKKSKFKIQMKKCTRSTYKIEEFEEKWKELMKECELANDDWLNSLYDIHSSWVPVYNRDIL